MSEYRRYRILHIDLNGKKYDHEDLNEKIFMKWIGGKGLAGYYLRPYINLPYDDPSMPVMIMAGPLVSTAAPTSGRSCIMSRSPLTGAIGDSSVGGSLGFNIRKSGIEGIVISGRSDSLVGIEIEDHNIRFTDAGNYYNAGTDKIYSDLKNKGTVVCTGIAADNGVLFANVMVDGNSCAGRIGLGTVFSSKNLKYITITGTGKIPVADPAGLKKAREDIIRLTGTSPVLMGEHGIAYYGTGALYDLMDNRRMMPVANFRRTKFEAAPSMNAVAYNKKYKPKRIGCKGCHIQCKKISADGRHHIPEFETMSHFSALLENEDINVVTEANRYCNISGMDTLTAAATLSCFAEITGDKLTGKRIMELLGDMATANGDTGKILAQGSYRYAGSVGKSKSSMTVKKLELPAYDPRGAYGMSLGYAMSTRGGCHLRAYPISHEILRKPVVTDRQSYEGKARIIKISEDINAIADSLTVCKFVLLGASLEEYSKAFTAVTGIEMSSQDLIKTGERIVYHERIMNAINGFTGKDDDLPERFFCEEGSSGQGINITPIDREAFLKAKQNYYIVRGLDEKGMPVAEKAKELGLEL